MRSSIPLLLSALSFAAEALSASVSVSLDVDIDIDISALGPCPPPVPPPGTTQYDFIVVGAGVGGGPVASRLVEAGFSVLLVDAGNDVTSINATIPFYFGRAIEDPATELNYTYTEYSPSNPNSKERGPGWYPRARALGGSTIHNAMINHIGLTEGDFNNIATMFNDESWSYSNMRSYFVKLENNLYEPTNDTDHGFNGWLKTSLNPTSIIGDFPDQQLDDIVDTMAAFPPGIIEDINSVASESAFGAGVPSYTIDENHNRSYVQGFILDAQAKSAGKLTVMTDTLVTKVQMCNGPGNVPTAYGVDLVQNAALAVASNFNGKQWLVPKLVTAKHEVIISAGVFQTPQLLMLSGIGNKTELAANGITPIVNLPGVGQNLQDHDELSTVWLLKQNHTLFANCTVLYTDATDPCLAYWTASGHQNIYSLGPALWMHQTNSTPGLSAPDLMVYWFPAYFEGFIHGFSSILAKTHNALTAIALHAHPSSRGSVTLTGSHPQDSLKIVKNRFEASGGAADIAALETGVEIARNIMANPTISQHVEEELFPGTSANLETHVIEHAFGHHACCTAKIGLASDPMAVLDNNFKVRGVNNLRVVDIAAWPNVPGWFVTTPTYMISEKAAAVLIAQYS
ncbi:Choline dehydrogenase [Mycena chlorophos]|uniref:Choline dehydrogenase n=1 Tax=Mycena chlorophos TaxID=658473 RepID=A0A8H6RWS2_MYCCL|nr:Choline dehydrogenase [Mycena chlorophos]